MNSNIENSFDNVHIVEYETCYQKSHSEFAKRIWPERHRRSDERFIRWKFQGPPQGPLSGFLLAIKNKKVVGQVGLIPAILRCNGRDYSTQWVCDFMVDPNLRGVGLGSLLLTAAIQRKEITLGCEPTVSSARAHRKAGFAIFPWGFKMLFFLEFDSLIQWKMPFLPQFFVPFLSKLGRPWIHLKSQQLTKKQSIKDIEYCSWQSLISLICKRQKHMKSAHIVHDETFLNWRCPGFKGHSEELRGLRTSNGGYALVEATPIFFHVHDWCAAHFQDALLLFQEIHRMAKASQSRMIRVTAQDVREKAELEKIGFLAMRTQHDILVYPSSKATDLQPFHFCGYDSDGNL